MLNWDGICSTVLFFQKFKTLLWDTNTVYFHNLITLRYNYLVFSRGKGPLKNTSDVINAAKKIAEAGSRMDKLARAVADQVLPYHVSKRMWPAKPESA